MLDFSSSIDQRLIHFPEERAFDRVVMEKAEKGKARKENAEQHREEASSQVAG